MTKFEEIKADYLAARKARSQLSMNLWSTFIGDLETQAKKSGSDVTDSDVVALLKKYIASADMMIQSNVESNDAVFEKAMLLKFLPKQLDELELRDVISKIIVDNSINNKKKMGIIMKQLKEKYDGQYDGKLASKIIGELLA